MVASRRLFTSESVTEGHPDKLADRISDSILDAYLAQDPLARVAVETLVTDNLIHIAGEVTAEADVDVEAVARSVVLSVGYDSPATSFDGNKAKVILSLGQQSPEISSGVSRALEARLGSKEVQNQTGAGDQGIMFGFACDETESLMPLPIHTAHTLSKSLAEARKSGKLPFLLPDGKTQVTVGYEGTKPVSIDTVVISTQHVADISQDELAAEIISKVILPVLDNTGLYADKAKILINPAGEFVTGGPKSDTGLTGRKIMVDTYGGMGRHGGGAFSGKDPSKVDRSAAYAMRWVAKNIVAAGLASRVEVQVAYAIGKASPVGLFVETFGTGVLPDAQIADIVSKVFDLRPAAIISELDLLQPIYAHTANYGHFGRSDFDFSWERLDRGGELAKLAAEANG